MIRPITIFLALAVALSVGAAAAASWPAASFNAQRTNFNPGEHAIGAGNLKSLRAVWTRSLPNVTTAVSSDSRVYLTRAHGGKTDVVVLNARNGSVLHTYTQSALGLNARKFDFPQALALASGRLVIGSTQTVLAINPENGHVYWRVPGGAGDLTIAGRTVYTGKGCQNECGSIIASYGIDLYTGHVLWTHPGNFGHWPTVIAGHLYEVWGENTGSTRVYNPGSGALLGTLPINGMWTGDSSHSYADQLTGAMTPNYRWWLEQVRPDGKYAWRLSLGKVLQETPPAYAYGTLYAASNRFHPGLIAVNARNGAVRWGQDLGQSLVMAAANHLLFVLEETARQLTVLDATSGKILRRLRAPAGIVTNPLLISGSTVYAVGLDRITAFRAAAGSPPQPPGRTSTRRVQ